MDSSILRLALCVQWGVRSGVLKRGAKHRMFCGGMRRNVFVPLILVFAAAVIAAGTVVTYRRTLYRPHQTGIHEAVFEIHPGQSLRTVTRRLADSGWIRRPRLVELYARSRGWQTRLQAGRYLLRAAMSPVEIVFKIVNGDAVFDELVITIPEGWSLDRIERHISARGVFSLEAITAAAVMQDAYRSFSFLDPLQDDTILDGYLFPDTYRVPSDSTPVDLIRRMLATFEVRTREIRATLAARDGVTLHEILTLASIVEAESADAAEMPGVAGVFRNRLRAGWRLESDATVNYVLGTAKRQPTFADTAVEHPYNTYENAGLPPGPIGNPGLASMRAALDPEDHEYYFFLHPLGGRAVYSRSFAEHLDNKARYLD